MSNDASSNDASRSPYPTFNPKATRIPMCSSLCSGPARPLLALLALVLGLGLNTQAQHLTGSVTAAAGGAMSNASFRLTSTLGEPVVGYASQTAQSYTAGFWLLLAKPATGTPVEDDGLTGLPDAYRLDANYPNPFNPQTTIRYALPEAASVRLNVYDAVGRLVRVLVDQQQAAGMHETPFAAGTLPSGLYFYRLDAGPFSDVRSMLLVK